MAKKKSLAYTYDIQNKVDKEYQSSPCWLLTFVRWTNRDTFNFQNDQLKTEDIFCVKNDCVSLSVSSAKSSPNQQMQAVLKSSTVDYLAAIGTGDFVFVNILGSEKAIDELAERAQKGEAINNFSDGFKGFFKVQSVGFDLASDREGGRKHVSYKISGFSFTEFNTKIYFQPLLIQNDTSNEALYLARLGKEAADINYSKAGNNAQNIVNVFISSTIGASSYSTNFAGDKEDISPNSKFYVPDKVGSLLGIAKRTDNKTKNKMDFTAKDIMSYIYGIQSYSQASSFIVDSGLTPCQGTYLLKVDYFNQTPLWSVLSQYVNSPVNEMYTSFRVNSENKVVPTFTMRQTPYSSPKYKGKSTQFLTIPRWRISYDKLLSVSLVKDETLRINFVQFFGRLSGNENATIALQQSQINYEMDINDIKRNGLQPMVFTSNADEIIGSNKISFQSIVWKDLMADILIGGHMRLSGSVSCVGIYDPIVHGDNFEINGNVFHIEGVTHSASIDSEGHKEFTTQLSLSHGVKEDADSVVYGNNDSQEPNSLDIESSNVPATNGDGANDSSEYKDFNLGNKKERGFRPNNPKSKPKKRKGP